MSTPKESYRALVQQYHNNGELSADARKALEIDRMTLRLLLDEVEEIEQDVLGQAPNPAQSELSPPAPAPKPEQMLPISGSDSKSPHAQTHSSPREPDVLPLHSGAFEPQSPPITTASRPPDYQSNRERYKQLVQQSYAAAGMLTSEATADLNRLAKAWGLDQNDEAKVVAEVVAAIAHSRLPIAELAASSPEPEPSPVEVETRVETARVETAPAYDKQLEPSFEKLEQALKNKQHRAADELTHEILLELIAPEQDWLDVESLKNFSPEAAQRAAIQKIDQLWRDSSKEKLGFTPQLALYGEISDDEIGQNWAEDLRKAQNFSQRAGWWIKPLRFYKFYNQLDFTPAEKQKELVHLPAYWFWQLPRDKAFQLGNLGVLKERGGCRVDAFTLPEFMRLLSRCGIKSAK
jgi:hypothetical protein